MYLALKKCKNDCKILKITLVRFDLLALLAFLPSVICFCLPNIRVKYIGLNF